MKRSAGSWLRTGAAGLAGLVAGGVLAGALVANAGDIGSSGPAGQGGAASGSTLHRMEGRDLSQPQRSDEELLTGGTLAKVKEAALAKYPDATVVRIETDSDGVYEATLTKADGTPVTVEVDKSFKVTGEEEMGPGGHHGFGHDGDGHHGFDDREDSA